MYEDIVMKSSIVPLSLVLLGRGYFSKKGKKKRKKVEGYRFCRLPLAYFISFTIRAIYTWIITYEKVDHYLHRKDSYSLQKKKFTTESRLQTSLLG